MLRLTGGEFRGRLIRTPSNLKTRPTQARLRQALFNSLQGLIPEARVLDLFAGSGALGFEALSRGASHVTFVEKAPPVIKLIEQNASDLKVLDRVEIITESVEKCWKRIQSLAPYDLVLADPPYANILDGGAEELKSAFPWDELVKPGGYFCLEWGTVAKGKEPSLETEFPFLVKVREKNYGDSVLTTFNREQI